VLAPPPRPPDEGQPQLPPRGKMWGGTVSDPRIKGEDCQRLEDYQSRLRWRGRSEETGTGVLGSEAPPPPAPAGPELHHRERAAAPGGRSFQLEGGAILTLSPYPSPPLSLENAHTEFETSGNPSGRDQWQPQATPSSPPPPPQDSPPPRGGQARMSQWVRPRRTYPWWTPGCPLLGGYTLYSIASQPAAAAEGRRGGGVVCVCVWGGGAL